MDRAIRGYSNKVTINFSSAYKEWLFVGMNFNIHTFFSETTTYITDTQFPSESIIQNARLGNLEVTEGSGFSFDIGGIAKVSDEVRLGLTYKSPTWYQLLDDYSQLFNTNNPRTTDVSFIDFSLVNAVPEYNIQVPSVVGTSFAYVFGKQGLFRIDYISKFCQCKTASRNIEAFELENQVIANDLVAVNNKDRRSRTGPFSLRAGCSTSNNPEVADYLGTIIYN